MNAGHESISQKIICRLLVRSYGWGTTRVSRRSVTVNSRLIYTRVSIVDPLQFANLLIAMDTVSMCWEHYIEDQGGCEDAKLTQDLEVIEERP